nr:hypothetical protein [Caldilineaceae bacterium]
MLVSLITPRLSEDDPISRRVGEQARFFAARGHRVVVYVAAGAAETAALTGVQTRQTLEDEHFAASDLFVFHAESPYRWLETLPKLERGAAVLYFHLANLNSGAQTPSEQSGRSLAALAAFADLVVAESEGAAELLVNEYGYTAQPVHLLPANEKTTAAEYEIYWAEAVAAATVWLPNRPYAFGQLPALAELHPRPNQAEETAVTTAAETPLGDSLLLTAVQQLVTSAATMQH